MIKLIIAAIFTLLLSACWLDAFVKPSTTQGTINNAKVLVLTYNTVVQTQLSRGDITKEKAQERLNKSKEIFEKIKLAESLLNSDPKTSEEQMELLLDSLVYMQGAIDK